MNSRVAALTLALALVIAVTTGCQPEPQPSPSGPVFANEDEAFAAAEETYRAYVDALNQVDLSDPETFEAVYAWTTGDANAAEKKSLTRMHADSWTVDGDTAITAMDPVRFELQGDPTVVLNVCTDVSDVSVLDAGGVSVVDADRPSRQAGVAAFVESNTSSTNLLIAEIEGGDHAC